MHDCLSFDILIYGVRDSHGNIWGEVVGHESTAVYISGLKNVLGEDLYFEDDARYISNWCLANGLEYTTREMVLGIAFPSKEEKTL